MNVIIIIIMIQNTKIYIKRQKKMHTRLYNMYVQNKAKKTKTKTYLSRLLRDIGLQF